MQLQRRKVEGWKPPVTLVSALTNSGLEELWEGILECHESLRLSGVLQSRRNTQAERWMWEHLRSQVQGLVHADPSLKGHMFYIPPKRGWSLQFGKWLKLKETSP